MKELSTINSAAYRQVVRENPRFVPYFRMATPETECADLNIGCRPPERKPSGRVESMRDSLDFCLDPNAIQFAIVVGSGSSQWTKPCKITISSRCCARCMNSGAPSAPLLIWSKWYCPNRNPPLASCAVRGHAGG